MPVRSPTASSPSETLADTHADCLARKGNEFDAMRQRHMNEDARSAVVANLTRHQRDPLGGASDFG